VELIYWKHRQGSRCVTPLGDALKHFRRRLNKGEPRIVLLRDYARIVVSAQTSYRARRFAKRFTRPAFGGTCWCCHQSSGDLVVHHIIQVQHGGRNTLKNLVWLCRRCHARVHPWLVRKPKVAPVAPVFDATPRLVRRAS
jgi:5-methylcytosine-specific restriction endonuclease McrA